MTQIVLGAAMWLVFVFGALTFAAFCKEADQSHSDVLASARRQRHRSHGAESARYPRSEYQRPVGSRAR